MRGEYTYCADFCSQCPGTGRHGEIITECSSANRKHEENTLKNKIKKTWVSDTPCKSEVRRKKLDKKHLTNNFEIAEKAQLRMPWKES
jgi:hypothetical protein